MRLLLHRTVPFWFLSVLLSGTVFVSADTGTSTSTLTIDPSASAGTTITAADENDRNSDTTTWAAAHLHRLSNSTSFGDAAAGNKSLCADAADSTDSCVRWNDTANLWQVDHPTAGTYNEIAVISGTSGLTSRAVLLGDGTGSLRALAHAVSGQVLVNRGSTVDPIWQTPDVVTTVVAFARTAVAGSGNQTVTGFGFKPAAIWVNCVQNGANVSSIGFGDDNAGEQRINQTAVPSWGFASDGLAALTNGGDTMTAVLMKMENDGFTVTWTAGGSGLNVDCMSLGVR